MRKLHAIKRLRDITGMGLKDAKEVIDELLKDYDEVSNERLQRENATLKERNTRLMGYRDALLDVIRERLHS